MLNHFKKFILGLCLLFTWIAFTPSHTLARHFGDMFGVDKIHTIWTTKHQEDALIYSIQTAINWVLWLLSAVALVLVIYAWFLMMTSWWDSKKYNQWLSIIKNAAIWLVIIGVSWLIVSLIFYVINGATDGAGGGE